MPPCVHAQLHNAHTAGKSVLVLRRPMGQLQYCNNKFEKKNRENFLNDDDNKFFILLIRCGKMEG